MFHLVEFTFGQSPVEVTWNPRSTLSYIYLHHHLFAALANLNYPSCRGRRFVIDPEWR